MVSTTLTDLCLLQAGYVQTSQELIFIQPASPPHPPHPPHPLHPGQWSGNPHLLYTCPQSPQSSPNLSDTGEPLPAGGRSGEPLPAGGRSGRARRSAGRTRYLEVAVVADHTVVTMHGQPLVKDYVLTLLNIANSVYQHPSLGVSLRVVVTQIILLPEPDVSHRALCLTLCLSPRLVPHTLSVTTPCASRSVCHHALCLTLCLSPRHVPHALSVTTPCASCSVTTPCASRSVCHHALCLTLCLSPRLVPHALSVTTPCASRSVCH
ncbi:hypothetical protein ACOMHN_064484 [Nucella lapillus]